jgi:hypothetical protein
MKNQENESVVKLTSEELDFIKNGTAQYNAVKSKIGDLEIQKVKLINEADAIVKAFLVNEKALIEKYGEQAVINLESGEVTQKEG